MQVLQAVYVLFHLLTVGIVTFACGRVYPRRSAKNEDAAWGVRWAACLLIAVWGLSYTFFLPLMILQLPPEAEAIVNTFLTFIIILAASIVSVWSVNEFLQLKSNKCEWLPFVLIPEVVTFVIHLIVSTPLTLTIYFASVFLVMFFGIFYFYRRYRLYKRLICEEYSNLTDRDLRWVSGLCVAMAIQSANFVGSCILDSIWLEFAGMVIVSFSALLLQQCAFRTKPLSLYLIEEAAVQEKLMLEQERTPEAITSECVEAAAKASCSIDTQCSEQAEPCSDAESNATPPVASSTDKPCSAENGSPADSRQKVYGVIRHKLKTLCEDEKVFLDPDLTREMLCSIIKVNRTYLSDYLRNEGMTYYNYINTLRINYAVELLRTTPELPLVDVSYRCGYSNPATFRRAFRDIMGCLPSEYVENLASKA